MLEPEGRCVAVYLLLPQHNIAAHALKSNNGCHITLNVKLFLAPSDGVHANNCAAWVTGGTDGNGP